MKAYKILYVALMFISNLFLAALIAGFVFRITVNLFLFGWTALAK